MKVETVKKSRAEYVCSKCRDVIPKGSSYRWTASFRGPTIIRCMKETCNFRPSDLEPNDKKAKVLKARENLEDLTDFSDKESVASELELAADQSEEARDEIDDSLGNMPDQLQDAPTGQQMQEDRDTIESWIDVLRECADEIRGLEDPEVDSEGKVGEQTQFDFETQVHEIFDRAIGELSL